MKTTSSLAMLRTLSYRTAAGPMLVLAMLTAAFTSASASDTQTMLWQIGKPDNDDREFALAPRNYDQFRDDGFFVVGKSDPQHDWPYVHPGPVDGWAGSRAHAFTIVFGLQRAPQAGDCTLQVDLVDTQKGVPPTLQISINGREFGRELPHGAGDASVYGDPAQGREHTFEISFPAELLKAGANEITLTTRSGSWLIYDWLGLDAPAGLELSEVVGTVLGSPQSSAVLVERNGRLMQTVQVPVQHFGDPIEACVQVEGADPLAVTLPPGPARFEVNVPAVEAPTTIGVTLDCGGITLGSQTVTLKPVRKWVVYLLPHSHVDIGYTHVQTDVERAQWKYLEMAIDAARKSADNPPGSRFKWNVEVLWAVDSYLKQATPEKREEFIAAVKAGQVGLQALYGNELTGLCRPEELLRLLSCAQEISKLCETPITSAMITDVPGYTWGMVPSFAHSGVKYFSIGPNGSDRIGHTIAAWGDKPFWWIGPNGNDKVLVWMTGTGYYRVFSSADNLLQYLGRLDEKGYPYDFVQVRHCLGDNGAPDVNFADTVKQWNDTHAYPKLVIATTDEMFRDFEQRYGDKLPTAQGDFTPYWEDGAASSALETAMNRASADRLTQAETLFAMFNPHAYPPEDFYQAWRNVLLYDEHTWGAHNSISQPDEPFVTSQWAIKRQFAIDADLQSRKLLAAANASRGPTVTSPSADMQAIDIINTTSYSHPWTLAVVPKELSLAGDVVKARSEDASGIPSQRLTSGELVFRPCAGSYSGHRYYITSGQPKQLESRRAKAEGLTLTSADSAVNGGLTVRLDEKSGAIASLRYQERELVDPHALTALNDYFYLPGSDLNGLQRNGPVTISVKEQGPLIASLLVESDAPGCYKLTREYRLHALRNYLEIINTVDKAPVRAKEGVHFGFGFQVPEGVARMDVSWGVVRPQLDQIPGACKNWFSVQRHVDISNQEFGVTLLIPDAPLAQFGSITANLIGSLSDPRAWLDRIEPSTTIYSWVMNNHWHTNYRAEQEGPTVFRYVIQPHGRRATDAQSARDALEYSQPLLVLPACDEQPIARGFQLVGTSGASQVQVTAFKPSEDGKAWIVRLFGVSGNDEKVTLKWNASEPKELWLSDNSEQPLLAVDGPVDVPAWSIVTLRADFPQ
ncbi:MAG: polysaccharide lyase family protein [Pirellulaceae bacterium]